MSKSAVAREVLGVQELENELVAYLPKVAEREQALTAAHAKVEELKAQRDAILLAAADGDSKAGKRVAELRTEQMAAMVEAEDLEAVLRQSRGRMLVLEKRIRRAKRAEQQRQFQAVMEKRLAVAERLDAALEPVRLAADDFVALSRELYALANEVTGGHASDKLLGTQALSGAIAAALGPFADFMTRDRFWKRPLATSCAEAATATWLGRKDEDAGSTEAA